MRGRDEIIVFHREVAHAHAREIELEWLPAHAVITRDVHAGLRAGEQQAATHDVLADGARVSAGRDSRVDTRPRLPVIAGFV